MSDDDDVVDDDNSKDDNDELKKHTDTHTFDVRTSTIKSESFYKSINQCVIYITKWNWSQIN